MQQQKTTEEQQNRATAALVYHALCIVTSTIFRFLKKMNSFMGFCWLSTIYYYYKLQWVNDKRSVVKSNWWDFKVQKKKKNSTCKMLYFTRWLKPVCSKVNCQTLLILCHMSSFIFLLYHLDFCGYTYKHMHIFFFLSWVKMRYFYSLGKSLQ